MQNKGLIQKTTIDKNDTNSSIYSITEAGMTCLNNWRNTLQEYAHKIVCLIQELPTDKETD